MKIALAQMNSWLGDFERNFNKLEECVARAKAENCDLVVFPEAAIFGYHPCDLLERPSVVEAQMKWLKKLHSSLPRGIGVLVGAFIPNPAKFGKPYFNAAVFLEAKKKIKVFAKELLPTYDVFDEGRHIEPGRIRDNVLLWRGHRILVTICEDIWAWPNPKGPRFSSYEYNPLKEVKGRVDFILNLSASPYAKSKLKNRQRVVGLTAKHFRAPMVYVNLAGGQDELIFDGGSFAVDKRGQILLQCQRFQEDFQIFEFEQGPKAPLKRSDVEFQKLAIVLGLRDYVRKTGFEKVHLGLSGGVDSAVVVCLAVEALGADNVTAFALPGPFSSDASLKLAKDLAERLKVKFLEVQISGLYEAACHQVEQALGAQPFGIFNENLQARLRALVLMGYSNRERSLLLATSNKSELATGYSTLYGDMCGALMPIGDLLKKDVYALARHFNERAEVIPSEIIARAPSAELRPNQKDQDSLPPYAELDAIVEKLVEGARPAKSATEKRVLDMLMKSEFKRWQSAPILKVSDHAFGRGRRFPVAHRSKN